MNTIRTASQQVLEAIEARRYRERAAERARLPIRFIDTLIADLEELNLDGRHRVPESFDVRLSQLAAAVPEQFRGELRSRVAISRLMDHLYLIQAHLFEALAAERGSGAEQRRPSVTPDFPRAS